MNTSSGATLCPRLKLGRIIARRLLLSAVVALLAACSTARLAYNQAPNLAYWWLDSHVDFSDAQSVQVRQDIDGFFAWHRSAELPLYASRLAQWQALVKQDITADQACAQFEALRSAYLRTAERGLEPLARLALQLSPEQLEHLQRHQAKGNQTFEKDFLRGSPVQRLDKRLEQAVDRYETLYGPLSAAQTTLIKTGLQQSPFDPQRSLAERLRRQTDLQKTIRQMQAAAPANGTAGNGSKPVPAAALEAVRAYAQRVVQSPTPGYADHSASVVRHGCAQLAALHSSTSPEQRAHAAGVLKGYEDDLRALTAAP